MQKEVFKTWPLFKGLENCKEGEVEQGFCHTWCLTGSSAKQLDMQIAEDAENYRIIFPPGVRTLKYFSKTSVPGTGDTGHGCLYMLHGTGTEMLKRLGLKKLHPFETKVALTVADKRVMTILG